MPRETPEWIGKTDNSVIPNRVKLRLFLRCGGSCEVCTAKITAGKSPEYDHIVALINGGENRESNMQVLCTNCHKPKTAIDVAIKSKTARVKTKHLGIRKSRNPMQSRGFSKPALKYSRAQNRMVEQ